jgi:hypothetical protein
LRLVARSLTFLGRDGDAAAQASRAIARSVEASGCSLCKFKERHPMSSSDLAAVAQSQQQAEQFETQLAQMQMQFEMKLDAAKAEKDAAQAIQNQG